MATGIALDEPRPGDSIDTIDIGDPGVRRVSPPGSESGTCSACYWIRTPSGQATVESSEGSVPSAGPSPMPQLNKASHSAPLPIPINDISSPQSPAPSRPSLSDYGSSPGGQLNSTRWDYAELTALKQKFNQLDEEGKGWLSRAQFFKLFSSILDTPGDDSSDQSSMFNFAYSLFYSSGERLNLKEFVAGMTILSKGSEEERLRYLFLMYDSDSSGYLAAEEIKQIFRIMSSFAKSQDFKASDSVEGQSLASLRMGNSENLEQLALKTLKEHDMNNDGKIGFLEFAKWCAKDPVVKTWMDMLAHGTARGVARLRSEREKTLLAKELDQLGFADKEFWRESFAINPSSQASSSVLPAAISSDISGLPSNMGDDSGELESLLPYREEASPPQNAEEVLAHSLRVQTVPPPPSPGQTASPPQRGHSRSLTLNAIGSFEIDFRTLVFESQIGSGSFATVWRAKWLDSPVAVKVFKIGPRLILNPDGTARAGDPEEQEQKYREGDESFEPDFDSVMGASRAGMDEDEEEERANDVGNHRVRFLQEVSLLKSIRHPNLLLYMGACVDPRYPLCIVSELIDGGSLFDCLHGRSRVNLNLQQKFRLMQNIARGMLYLHGRDPIVLHRDLKSANILVSLQKDGNFKATIIDFGLSKLNTTQASLVPGRARGLTGSLVTMAPEVMNEQKYQTGSDVYSFGIVCWEIFCGRIPFGKTTQVATLVMKVAVRGERPKFLKDDNVPLPIQRLIRECWDQDVTKRPDFLAIAQTLNVIRRDLELLDN